MKKISQLVLVIICLAFVGCSNGDGGEKDPSETHPPSAAVPDSMKLVNDSVIMPDTIPGNGDQTGNSDSIQKQIR